jgi:hypothetical protein
LGLALEEWWTAHKQQLNASLSSKTRTYDGVVALGILPYGYLPEHVRQWNEPVRVWDRFFRKQQQWKEKLERLGWAVDNDDPERIEHRYVVIRYTNL